MISRSPEYFAEIEQLRPGLNYDLLLPDKLELNNPQERDRLYDLKERTIACLLELPYYYTRILHYVDLQQTMCLQVSPIYTSEIKMFCGSILEENIRHAVWHMGKKGFMRKFTGGKYVIHPLILEDKIIRTVRSKHVKTF